ncbi:MAG: ribulose phosphate epimerase [Myxococcota bacterium]
MTLGCGPRITWGDAEGAGSDTTFEGPTMPGDPTVVPSPPSDSTLGPVDDSGTTLGPVDDTGNPFIVDRDGGVSNECDLWLQDCPKGEKCTPSSTDGTNWDYWRCVPVVDDPGAPGEPCIVEENPWSGLDDCDQDSMCVYVDARTLEGTCLARCVGDEVAPMCEESNSSCSIPGDGIVAVCIPYCDPLAQDCVEGQGCYEVGGEFTCAPDASGDMGVPGDPCEFINVCDPGAACVVPQQVPDCMGAFGCCTSYCSLDDPMPPCLPGQICLPVYESGAEPPGLELLGWCTVP